MPRAYDTMNLVIANEIKSSSAYSLFNVQYAFDLG